MNELFTTPSAPIPPLEQARRRFDQAQRDLDEAGHDETGALHARLEMARIVVAELERKAMGRSPVFSRGA